MAKGGWNRFRMLFEIAPDAMLLADASTAALLDANQAALDLFGYDSLDEFRKRSIPDIDFNETPEENRAHIEKVMRVGRDDFETRTRTPSGDFRDLSITVMGVEEEGRPLLYCVARDITHLKKTESRLKEALDTTEGIFRSIPVGFSIYRYVDGQLVYEDWNPAAERILGIDLEQHRGKVFEESWPDAEKRGLSGAYHRVMETGEPFQTEDVYYADDKVQGAFAITAFRMPGPRLGIAFSDVTEQKKHQEALRSSEYLNRTIVETVPALIYVYDLNEQRNIWSNGGVELFLGYSPEEIRELGDELFPRLLHPDDLPAVMEHQERLASATDGEVLEVLYRMKASDGTWHHLHSWERIFRRNPDGSPSQTTGAAIDETERIRMEEALQASEERYRRIFDGAQVSLWELDFAEVRKLVDGLRKRGVKHWKSYLERKPEILGEMLSRIRITNVNESACSLLRAEDQDQLVDRFPSIFTQGTLDTLGSFVATLAGGGRHFESEVEVRALDGETLELLAQITSIASRSQDWSRVLVSAVDITEINRLRRELALRNRIKQAFLTTEDDRVYADVLKVLLDAMDSPFGVFGYIDETGDLVVPTMTRTVWDQCDVEDKTIVFPREKWGCSSWPRAIREKKWNYSNEPSSLTPEGHISIERHVSMPILHLDQVVGLIQVANKPTDYSGEDIRLLEILGRSIAPVLANRLDHGRREIALQESEERHRHLTRAMTAVVWTTDASGAFVRRQESWEKYTGQSWDEHKGFGWADMIHPEDREEVGALWARAVEERSPYHSKGRVFCKADNDYRFFEARAVPVVANGGSVREWIGTIEDVHARRTAEMALTRSLEDLTRLNQELERSNRELEQFAYVASHDLQEPLRTISSCTQVVASKFKGKLDNEADEFIDYAVDGAHRMQQLIQDLLAYSRVTTRGGDFEETDLVDVLGQVHNNLMASISEAHALITHDDLPTIRMDRGQMVRLLQNLLANAIKFSREGEAPLIHIGASRDGDFWRISVQDNGIGMESKHHDRIFGVFQRLDASRKRPGTGIGLAICKRIVERHGGSIEVDSRPGKGSTFHFTIPDGKEKQR